MAGLRLVKSHLTGTGSFLGTLGPTLGPVGGLVSDFVGGEIQSAGDFRGAGVPPAAVYPRPLLSPGLAHPSSRTTNVNLNFNGNVLRHRRLRRDGEPRRESSSGGAGTTTTNGVCNHLIAHTELDS